MDRIMFKDEASKSLTLTLNHFCDFDQASYSWSLNNTDNSDKHVPIVINAEQPLSMKALSIANQLKTALVNGKNESKQIQKIIISSSNQKDDSNKTFAEGMIFLCGLLICSFKPNDILWEKLR
jgi:hypothetical protein